MEEQVARTPDVSRTPFACRSNGEAGAAAARRTKPSTLNPNRLLLPQQWGGGGGSGSALRHFEATGGNYPLVGLPHPAAVLAAGPGPRIRAPFLPPDLSGQLQCSQRTTAAAAAAAGEPPGPAAGSLASRDHSAGGCLHVAEADATGAGVEKALRAA